MKKTIVLLVAGLLLMAPSSQAEPALGSAFGNLCTARALGQGMGNLGLGVGLADGTSFVGSFAFGLSRYSDGRIKLGLWDPGGGADTKIALGVDYKWQFWSFGPESSQPFDFGVGAFLEYVDFEYVSALQLGGQLVASYPVKLSSGRNLTPYGRFNARLESLSYDHPIQPSGDDSESNLEIGLNGGVQWEMTSTVNLYAEFQIDGNDGLFLGIDFNIM